MSKLVLRIIGPYVAGWARTIASLGMFAALSLPAPVIADPAGMRSKFCVLVPHFKDEYWLSVGYGLEQAARRQNLDLMMFEAGGYRARAAQIDQLDVCIARGADAILIGAVTSDHPDLLAAIDQAAQQVPVFGLVNALHSGALTARVGVDWRDMGYVLGDHLRGAHPAGSPPKTAVLLSGTPEAGWTAPLEAGLHDGLADSAVTIAGVLGADTGLRQQLAIVEQALEQYPDADYLIGSAPAIEAAVGLLAARPDAKAPQLLATYMNHTVKRGLINGSVMAASFDDPVLQARMAIDQANADAPQSTDSVGPPVIVVTNDARDLDVIRMAPTDYFPQIQ